MAIWRPEVYLVATEKFTAGQMIAALKAAHGIKARAAEILSCSRHTIDNYIKRHPTIAAAYAELRETVIDLAEAQLIGQLNAGYWPAIKFVLVTLGRERGWVPGQDITSAGQPIARGGGFCIIEVPANLDEDEDDAAPL